MYTFYSRDHNKTSRLNNKENNKLKFLNRITFIVLTIKLKNLSSLNLNSYKTLKIYETMKTLTFNN